MKTMFTTWIAVLCALVSFNSHAQTVANDTSNCTPGLINPNATLIMPNCGQSSGAIHPNPTGGVPPYTYSWNTGSTGTAIFGLAAGVYNVTVTDANGCSGTEVYTLADNPAMIVIPTIGGDTCAMANGSIAVTIAGGIPPYTYQWSNGGTGSNVSGLAEGTYYLTVTDSVGCAAPAYGVVEAVSSPHVSISATDAGCDHGGAVSVIPSGGATPYSFIWADGQTSSSLSGLDAGSYAVTVSDVNGCSAAEMVSISSLGEAPSAALTVTAPNCGFSDGSINTDVAHGEAPYTYLWSNGATAASIAGVGDGTYTVTVTGANGCSTADTVLVFCQSSILSATAPDAANVSLYPNPTTDGYLNLDGVSLYNALTVYDAAGRNVYNVKLANMLSVRVRVPDVTAGVYTLELRGMAPTKRMQFAVR